jgi:hypothetical protein
MRRSLEFLRAHVPATPPAVFTEQLASLAHAVERLTALAVGQDAGRRAARSETRAIATASGTLVERHMRPIAHLARALLQDVPGVERAVVLPDRREHPERLTAAAGALTELAEAHAARLVEAGLPPTFVAELRGATAAVRDAVARREASRRRQSGATSTVKGEMARGHRAMALLDALLPHVLGDDEELLAEWRSTRRVGRRGRAGQAEPTVPAAGIGTRAPEGEAEPRAA